MEPLGPVRTDQRLTVEQQQAVLLLAVRLQQQYDEGATLADLIAIGQEAGISRQAIEEAFHVVLTQGDEPSQRHRLERAVKNELGAVCLTALWAAATWLGILFLPANEFYGTIGVGGSFVIFPVMVGLLVHRHWFAAGLTLGIMMNLMIAFTVRLGFPDEAGARADMIIFALPVLLALTISAIAKRISRARHQGNWVPS